MMHELWLVVPNLGTRDALGAWHRAEETTRRVLARIEGVRRSEWSVAGGSGHRPELVAVVPTPDYRGEAEVLYNGRRYAIYRTYPVGDWETELYLEAKGGVTQ